MAITKTIINDYCSTQALPAGERTNECSSYARLISIAALPNAYLPKNRCIYLPNKDLQLKRVVEGMSDVGFTFIKCHWMITIQPPLVPQFLAIAHSEKGQKMKAGWSFPRLGRSKLSYVLRSLAMDMTNSQLTFDLLSNSHLCNKLQRVNRACRVE